MNRLLRLFLPSGLLTLLAAFVLMKPAGTVLYSHADTILAITTGVSLFIILRFGASRQFFALAMLTGLAWGTPFFLPSVNGPLTNADRWYFCMAAVLTPFHCLLFAWWADRGLLNGWGIARLIWLALVPVPVAIAARFPAIINHPYFVDYVCRPLSESPHLLAGPAAAFILCGVLLLLMHFRDSTPNHEGFFWVTALLALAFLYRPEPVFFRLTTAAAMLCLLLTLIEAGLFFAFRDELTGLPARRALNNQLRKAGGKYTLAMVDVDHFKRFNDRYGHDVGDEVLKMVATRLKKSSGRAFRFGGEEFTLLYPGREIDRAMADAEAVRKKIADARFTIRNPRRKKGDALPPKKVKKGHRKKVSVTVSMGLARRSATDTTAAQVLKAADKALYQAKKEGRNRVVKGS
ncbi:MAG: GGDEF domain-containing protein [Thermodesulfobacteriota bacterium]|nr:GGDEF domain-containing protein [Thermodesulfobacteriota bacterium]